MSKEYLPLLEVKKKKSFCWFILESKVSLHFRDRETNIKPNLGFKKKIFIYLFLERGDKREKERERNISVCTSCIPPTGDLAQDPGMCPDWESKEQPFGSQVSTQSTELYQSGLNLGV